MMLATRIFAPVFIAVVLATVASFMAPVRPARACSVIQDYDPTENAVSVVLGRITAIDSPAQKEPMAETTMHVSVERTLTGAVQPEQLELTTRVQQPGQPIMCLEIDPAEYEGKQVVMALHTNANGLFIEMGALSFWRVERPAEGTMGQRFLEAVYLANPPIETESTVNSNSDDGTSWAWAVAGVVALLVAGTAFVVARRRYSLHVR